MTRNESGPRIEILGGNLTSAFLANRSEGKRWEISSSTMRASSRANGAPRAIVHADPERKVLTRILPPDIEAIRVGEDSGIAVGRRQQEEQLRILRQSRFADFDRLLRLVTPCDDRAIEAQHFFDRVRNQVGIATNRLLGRAILQQAAKAVSHELSRRLVPREQHLQHDAGRLLAGERIAVAVGLASLHESADEIVAWAFGSGLHQGRSVAPEGRQLARRLDLLVLAGAPVVTVPRWRAPLLTLSRSDSSSPST